MRSSNNLVNPLPGSNANTYLYIYNLHPTRSTSNKFIYPNYYTMYRSSAPGATQYHDAKMITVVPKYNGLAGVKMEQHGNVYDEDFTYPGFLRVESTTFADMNYVIQENE
jgi:hypothetical protein